MQRAYYSADLAIFLATDSAKILGELARHHAHDLNALQKNAWLSQIRILQTELKNSTGGWIAFEFAIPRMGKRADVVFIRNNVVFVLEFKVGAGMFDASAIDQVLGYALDLKHFHETSHETPIVPVLISTNATVLFNELLWDEDVSQPILTPPTNLDKLFRDIEIETTKTARIDPYKWMAGRYHPTPTIIEAAQALYANHNVEDITRSGADTHNLSVTTDAIAEIVADSRAKKKKSICFVTGVPGAGKTLAGLNLVAKRRETDEANQAVFLSGNGPLVDVLREALAIDDKNRAEAYGAKKSLSTCRKKVEQFIQNIHHFRDEYLKDQTAPFEHIAVFDEAQRAWHAEKLAKFMQKKDGIEDFTQSEPELLIGVMNRHEWCTVVCLIGGGQEINDGEAGLVEWFSSLKKSFPTWDVYISPVLNDAHYHWGQDLGQILDGLNVRTLPELHLKVAVRSYRAKRLSDFVGAFISGDTKLAKEIYREIRDAYPMPITRDLSAAKAWLKQKARGSHRIGLVASSNAIRLKADGLNVKGRLEPAEWFLKPKDDVRSSFYLEDPATEFHIQGLELDWVALCWEGNYRRESGRWAHYAFVGTRWQIVHNETNQAYLANSYRVLMTRARQGMVIYVPSGSLEDGTRDRKIYDGTWEYLKECGLAELE